MNVSLLPAREAPANADGGTGWDVIEARCDWITLVAGVEEDSTGLLTDSGRIVRMLAGQGDRERRWSGNGYTGYRCTGVSYGVRADGVCLHLSGVRAHEFSGLARTLAGHCTRLDLCVTAVGASDARGLAARTFSALQRTVESDRVTKNRRLVMDAAGGQTLYLGHRSDDIFVRLYNKHAESPDGYPDGAWRWEAELKGETARQRWPDFQENWPTSDATVTLVSDYVQRLGGLAPFTAGYHYTAWKAPQPRREPERAMRWLSSQVRESIAHLKAWYSDGEIARALDLDPNAPRLPTRW